MRMPIIDQIATAKNIRALKDEQGRSARDIQRACCLETVQSVYKWLYGQSLPSLDNLVVLAYIFKVPIDEIIVVRFIEMELECGI